MAKKKTGKIKPVLDEATTEALQKRDAERRKMPKFRRQEWHRYQRLGTAWRRPRGLHSKMRKGLRYRTPVATVGYRTPVKARGLHPSGFEEVLVYNVKDVETLDPKAQAARIGHSVGVRKRVAIIAKAEEMKLRVLNRGGE